MFLQILQVKNIFTDPLFSTRSAINFLIYLAPNPPYCIVVPLPADQTRLLSVAPEDSLVEEEEDAVSGGGGGRSSRRSSKKKNRKKGRKNRTKDDLYDDDGDDGKRKLIAFFIRL